MGADILATVVLRPLSWIYGAVVGIRGWLYDRGLLAIYHSKLPVVSIGNLTAGGNGKTPLCLFVAQELRNRGYRPVILSRGYGGRTRGPKRVYHSDTPRTVGDEAILMFRSGVAPVYVARARADGAALIERDEAGDVIVLDDGFQHRALARDVDIVSVYVGNEQGIQAFQRGALLPWGRFRENRDDGLRRATIVVVSERKVVKDHGLGPIDSRILDLIPDGVKAYRSTLQADAVTCITSSLELKPCPVVALAAIANPDGFFSSVESLGFDIVERISFADHHHFTETELRRILERHPSTPVVCTVKDGVKVACMPEDVAARFACLHVRARVAPSDAFAVQIVRALQARQ